MRNARSWTARSAPIAGRGARRPQQAEALVEERLQRLREASQEIRKISEGFLNPQQACAEALVRGDLRDLMSSGADEHLGDIWTEEKMTELVVRETRHEDRRRLVELYAEARQRAALPGDCPEAV